MSNFRLAYRIFLICLAGASFTILPLTAIADQPAPTAAPAEDKNVSRPIQEVVDVPATENPQSLQFKNNRVEVNLPKGYLIKKFELGGRTQFAFSGPKNPDGTAPGVMFFVVDWDGAEERPSDKAVLEMMLKPGKNNLSDFQQKDDAAVQVNGKSFENAEYSGTLPEGKKLKGFFYVGGLKNGFLVFAGRDGGEHFKDSADTLRGIVSSCKVQDE